MHERPPTTPDGVFVVRTNSRTEMCDTVDHVDFDDSYHRDIGRFGSTSMDRKDMDRMGKIQELRRSFRPLSTFSFLMLSQGTWEVLMLAVTQGLGDGGLAGLFWSYTWTFFGILLVNLSLAEMASMAPTSGGQYHWVSEFSPPRYQKFLSHVTGWMSTLSLQAGSAAGPFIVGTIIQSFITLDYPSYSPTQWQGTLFVFATTIPFYSLNRWYARAMPVVQNMALVVHIGAFMAFVIIFWVLSPRNTASIPFTQFADEGGWMSIPVSMMIGQSTSLYALVGVDMAAHISEEIVDASTTVPQALMGSYLVNSTMGFVFLVSFLFTITNIDNAISDETGFPFIWVLRQSVPTNGINGLIFIALVLIFVSTISFNLATSRATWAFARDNGLPFSKHLSHVDPKHQVPDNAILWTNLFVIVVSLINLGSEVAFDAIVSLNLIALMVTFMIPIGCVLVRRIRYPELLPPARAWSLGRWGVPINIAGFVYSIFAGFWAFWPNATHVEVKSFNWGSLMFLLVVVASVADYFFRARYTFQGPVAMTRGWRD